LVYFCPFCEARSNVASGKRGHLACINCGQLFTTRFATDAKMLRSFLNLSKMNEHTAAELAQYFLSKCITPQYIGMIMARFDDWKIVSGVLPVSYVREVH